MKLGKLARNRPPVSVFKVVAPQDGGWSLMPMESLLRGVRSHEDMLALELYSVDGVVSYAVRTRHGDSFSGMIHSYYPQAEVTRHVERAEDEPNRSDWLFLHEEERALVQPLGLQRESYLPLHIFDDRTIEQSKMDPLAGVIGLLASATRSGGMDGSNRFGLRLMIRPAREDWNAPWQNRMQQRRDGDDRAARPGGPAPSGPSMTAMMFGGGLLAFLGANWWLWQQGNMGGMVAFDLMAVLFGGLGTFLWQKFGKRRGRAYLDEELVEAKLKSLAFWSELQLVRIYKNEADEDEVHDNMERIMDCMRSFDDPAGNAWKPGRMRTYIGTDISEHKHVRHPFVGGSSVMEWEEPKMALRTALSAREVASIWHPPLGVDEMASMERTAVGVFTPYLADLSTVGEDSGPLVGTSVGEGHQIYLPESSLRKHTIILGKSGVGKSTMIKHVVAHKLERKADGRDDSAIVVIDPHADLVRDILKLVPPSIAHKVRLLDFGRMDRVPGINLVDPQLFPDRDRCVDTIIGTVKHLWEHWGGRLEDLLKNSLLIVYEFNSHPQTPRNEMLTMLDILALLDDGNVVGSGRDAKTEMSSFQRHALSRVSDPRLKQWFQSYLNWPRDTRAEAVGPVHSRIGAYAKDQRASVIMGQRESTIMLQDVLKEGLILLVSTAQGSIGVGPAALMGGTMVSLVESALRDQESIEASKRAKCLLICDEFQTVSGANWEGMLAEIRKYGCSLMLSTQSLARLDTPERKLKAGILGNVGCMVSYQMSAEDAHIMSAEMDAERVRERDLVNLHPHYCVVRINSDTKCYPAFSMRTLAPPESAHGADESEQAVLAASMAYTTDWAEARDRMNDEISVSMGFSKIGADGAPDKTSDQSQDAGGAAEDAAGAPAPDAAPSAVTSYTLAMEQVTERMSREKSARESGSTESGNAAGGNTPPGNAPPARPRPVLQEAGRESSRESGRESSRESGREVVREVVPEVSREPGREAGRESSRDESELVAAGVPASVPAAVPASVPASVPAAARPPVEKQELVSAASKSGGSGAGAVHSQGSGSPLDGINPDHVEDSAFAPEMLVQIIERVNTDPGLRDVVDKRTGNHISRERKKVRDEETGRIRAELYRELETEFEKLGESQANFDSFIEGERKRIAEEERQKALDELSGAVDPSGGSRDTSILRRPPARR